LDTANSTHSQVITQNFAFNPDRIYVRAGTLIRWVNQDAVSHTVTSDDGSSFDSGTLLSGESFERRFVVPGTYPYFCSTHPSMRGAVIAFDSSLEVFLPLVLN
jgi:plastocyanin